MKFLNRALIAGVIGLGARLHLPAAPVPAAASPALQAPSHVVVKFKPALGPQLQTIPGTNRLAALLARLRLPDGAELKEPHLATLQRQREPRPAAGPDLSRFVYLHLPPELTVEQCVERLRPHPDLEYVEPDGIGSGGATIPSDPNFLNQWQHTNAVKPSATIKTPDAWDVTTGSSNVLVAVLDTGLTATLPEFTGRVVPGYNFVSGNPNTLDDHGHGTAVSSVLCANANNGVLGAGVDWRCRLLPVKVLNANNTGTYSSWAQAVDFAVNSGAKVINLSAGGSGSSSPLTEAIQRAIAQGVLFITITHNNGVSTITYPGNLTNCITVGATDSSDRRANFSNYGPEIDLVAPGVSINILTTNGTLSPWNGTSFSAPMVSGVCALLAALRPNISQDEARTLLCAGADDRVGDATDTPGFDVYHGWGRLNAFNTLLLAQTRFDRMQRTNGSSLALSWRSPNNASNKQPYQIEFTTSLTSGWTPLPATNRFRYEPGRTFWTDDGTETGTNFTGGSRFYRVRVR